MRRAIITTAVAAALGLAACGGGGDGDGGGAPGGDGRSARERAQDGALAFARCMRENGIDMPDPQLGENGLIRIAPGEAGPGEGPGPDDPRFRKADEACRKHLEAGMEEPSPEQQAEMRDAFVKYARCMRAEGIELPDPEPGGGIRFRVGDPDAPDLDSPTYQAADRRCGELLAGVGPRAQDESP